MKSIILSLFLALSITGCSQKISDDEAAKLYVQALTDFESSSLKLHEKDKKVLVTQSHLKRGKFPSEIGQSTVQWFNLDDDLTDDLKGDIKLHNGRSVITISHRQSNEDTVKVRVDQWTIDGLEVGLTMIPIDEDAHPDYLKKNHEYLFVRANSEWRLLEKANDLNPTTERQKEIEEIFQKGNSLHRQGKYKEALEHVERSMAMDSSLYQRYMFRARIKTELGMYDSAIADVTKCIDRCDCSTREFHVPSYYLERAEIHSAKGDNTAALSDINKSISLNPEAWKAYFSRAALSIQSEDFESALDDLNKSMKLDDDIVETYFLRGMVNIALGNNKAACSDLKVAIEAGFEEPRNWVEENCK